MATFTDDASVIVCLCTCICRPVAAIRKRVQVKLGRNRSDNIATMACTETKMDDGSHTSKPENYCIGKNVTNFKYVFLYRSVYIICICIYIYIRM